ncbi:MAG: hypothetical protein C0622_05675 [Desulfuromonas sp.]|nr:MAG: hypothetical protein C0622_05675 [Desulfuromonas sp.]
MYFVPLSQIESVELLIHSLKAAGGEADCTMCPAYKVCMKQCLTIAESVEQMLKIGALPEVNDGPYDPDPEPTPSGGGAGGSKSGLRVIK